MDSHHETTYSQVPPPTRCVADRPETTAPLRADWPRLLAWPLVPLLLAPMAVLWAADLPDASEMALNIFTRTLASLLIVCLAHQSLLTCGRLRRSLQSIADGSEREPWRRGIA
jgi:hypothetical protein